MAKEMHFIKKPTISEKFKKYIPEWRVICGLSRNLTEKHAAPGRLACQQCEEGQGAQKTTLKMEKNHDFFRQH